MTINPTPSPAVPPSPANSTLAPNLPTAITLPESWRPLVEAHFRTDEYVLAWLDIDLNTSLRFAKGIIVLTNQRLLARTGDAAEWQSHPLDPALRLTRHAHAGVGSLELFDTNERIAWWRYTLGQDIAAGRLIDQFERQIEFLATGTPPASSDQAFCPKCEAPLPAGQDECPPCTKEELTPPSTWTLLRLWRFAHPYRWRLLAGFLLSLASTAATLVPPYLTMPLMDKVLIPFQNGTPIDPSLVARYLSGLLGALAQLPEPLRHKVRLHIHGKADPDLRATTREMGIAGMVQIWPSLDYLDALARMRMMDWLFVNDTASTAEFETSPYLPSKLADYKAAGRAVLAFAEPGSPLSQAELPAGSIRVDMTDDNAVLDAIIRIASSGEQNLQSVTADGTWRANSMDGIDP